MTPGRLSALADVLSALAGVLLWLAVVLLISVPLGIALFGPSGFMIVVGLIVVGVAVLAVREGRRT